MILILLKRLAIIFPLLGANFLQCPFGDPITTLDIYNKRNKSISVYYKLHFYERLGIPEERLDIRSSEMKGITQTGLYKPLSRTVIYLIIRDSNGTEIMNLRGNPLDKASNIVKETADDIEYRLDVN